MSDEEDYILFGNQLKEFAEGDKIRKRPISIEEQIATDQNGKRRFHGAFTGGFSAGFFNTVDTPQGWTPSQFKSSRKTSEQSSGDRKLQKPEDFMDDEDFGHFGFASQALKTKSKFQSKEKGSKPPTRRDENFLAPVINQMIQPTLPTIGETLLRKQGWKPGQGIGPKIDQQSKKDRKKSFVNTYGVRKRREERSDSESDDDIAAKYKDFLFAPDELPVYVATPKENMFGIGYQGLDRPTHSVGPSPNSYNIKTGLNKKKFSISGEAFGVGAYEEDDDDVYNKSDMGQYDYTLDLQESVSSSRISIATQNSSLDKLTDVLDGFTLSTRKSLLMKSYPPPRIPRDWTSTTSGYTKKSRFSPAKQPEQQVNNNSNMSRQQRRSVLFPDKTKDESESGKNNDIDKEMKDDVKEEMPDFLTNDQKSVSSVGNFKPFQSDSAKQLRYEQFLVCIQNNRRDALKILQPKTMTEWERERERVEFERAAHLYKPMNTAIASRFVSSGTINEDGSVGAGVLVDSTPSKTDGMDKDKRHAAQMKMFGKMTRESVEWVPARILCVRFNVKNPFNNEREHDNRKKKPIFESNQLFSMLGGGSVPHKTTNDKKENIAEDVKEEHIKEDAPVENGTLALVKDEPDISKDKPPMDLFKAIFADSDTDGEVDDDNSTNDHSICIPETMKSEKRRRESSPQPESSCGPSARDSPSSSSKAGANDDPTRGIFAGINFDKFVKRRRKTPPPMIPMKALTSRPKTILDRSIRNILGIKSGDISDDEYGPVAPPPVAAPAKSIVISSDDNSSDWEEKDKSKKKKKKGKHKKEKKSKKKKKKQKSYKSDSN